MNVLVLSNMYPSNYNEINSVLSGIFVHEVTKAIKYKLKNVQVIAPIPFVPSILRHINRKFYFYNKLPIVENIEDIVVHRFRRILTPYGKPQSLLGEIIFNSIRKEIIILNKINKFDLIHVHTIYPMGYVAAKIKKFIDLPIICTIHGGDINYIYKRNSIVKNKIIEAIESTDHIITVAQVLKSNLLNFHKTDRPISVIPNGVNIQKFPIMNRTEIQRKLNIDPRENNLLFVGHLIRIKGLEFLFKCLTNIDIDFHLYLIGEGPLKKRLRNFAKNNNFYNKISFLGYKQHKEMHKWMSAMDLLILPSLSEGCPTIIFEAFASQLPVVATSVGGIPEVIKNTDYGILCRPNKSDELCNAIKIGLNKEWDKRKLRKYAENNTWNIVADKIIKIYKTI